MSFDHVMVTACARTITLLYIYFCVWELDLRLNNINYPCWLSYAIPPTRKLHPCSDINSKLYKPIFLATCLIAVLQPSGYFVFHGRDTPIQLSLPWQSYFYQCLNTETSAQGNRCFTTETPSISYTICFVYKTNSYTIIH